jgi:hypothetical protein
MKTSIKILMGLAFPLATLLLAGTDAIACGNGKLIVEDKFGTLNPAWGFAKDDPTRSNGPDGLVYKLKPGDAGYTQLNQSDLYDNYEVCAVFVTNVSEKSYAYIGVNFWADDYDNSFRVNVYPFDGTYALGRKKNGKFIWPIAETPSDTIQKGTNVTNEISVTVSGNEATIAVNGKKMTDYTGAPPKGGSVFGFALGIADDDPGPATITLKSIQLREVEGQPGAGH